MKPQYAKRDDENRREFWSCFCAAAASCHFFRPPVAILRRFPRENILYSLRSSIPLVLISVRQTIYRLSEKSQITNSTFWSPLRNESARATFNVKTNTVLIQSLRPEEKKRKKRKETITSPSLAWTRAATQRSLLSRFLLLHWDESHGWYHWQVCTPTWNPH